MALKSVCVYCGSRPGAKPAYAQSALDMGAALAHEGWRLVYGAGDVGLTFAAMGFIWACFGGVFLINLGIRKGWLGGHTHFAFIYAPRQGAMYSCNGYPCDNALVEHRPRADVDSRRTTWRR